MQRFHYTIEPKLMESQYQHLHHADALRFLERARLDLLETIGFPLQSLIAQDLFLVITKIEVQYKRELHAGEITVECGRTFQKGREIVVEQRIFNHKGKLAIEALVASCCMSGQSRRGVMPPENFLRAFLSACPSLSK